jgi:uncharacterized SAM-binding protein YcdF (DUF218 family)
LSRKPRRRWQKHAILTAIVLGGALLGWAMLERAFIPQANTQLTHFDAIIVLGYKADSDGNPTPRQLARVTEGVHEYMRGVAPRLVLTGGAASNRFVEAQVMARVAEAQGIPASAIFVEPKAQNTIENACFATHIMKAHGWKSAEVVSSSSHLPRAAMIFSELPIEWRMHAAPSLEPPSPIVSAATDVIETLKTVRYLVYAEWADRCAP